MPILAQSTHLVAAKWACGVVNVIPGKELHTILRPDYFQPLRPPLGISNNVVEGVPVFIWRRRIIDTNVAINRPVWLNRQSPHAGLHRATIGVNPNRIGDGIPVDGRLFILVLKHVRIRFLGDFRVILMAPRDLVVINRTTDP